MEISVFDLFTIGIGPSSSHSVGPMRAANRFVAELRGWTSAARLKTVRVELFGSLALTGIGHGTDKAVLIGLEGATPETVDPDSIGSRVADIRSTRSLQLGTGRRIEFDVDRDLILHRNETLPLHSNAMRFTALTDVEHEQLSRVYYSVGGGFVVSQQEADRGLRNPEEAVPYPFHTAADLLNHAQKSGLALSDIMLSNEKQWRTEQEIRDGLLRIWRAMRQCVEKGCQADGVLPGGLRIVRRAPQLYRDRCSHDVNEPLDPLYILDWVDLFAIAVNEENAAGGRVVTAPTNGAAGIVPAVMHYYDRFCPGASEDGIVRFLLTAGAIAMLYKNNASISGAEVGCQGEVGVACSMAAGALTEVLGGTPAQVEQAAEIGMEHNLGLTCDPIGGLVQVPCIERNAMGAVKAINAARLALRSDGQHHVSLDRVIAVMRRTGADMSTKYKETSRGGLAVNISEC